MRLDPRVLEFLKESATPEKHLKDYLNDATFRALLPAIKRYAPRCSDSLRKQWAAAFLALIDVPLTFCEALDAHGEYSDIWCRTISRERRRRFRRYRVEC